MDCPGTYDSGEFISEKWTAFLVKNKTLPFIGPTIAKISSGRSVELTDKDKRLAVIPLFIESWSEVLSVNGVV